MDSDYGVPRELSDLQKNRSLYKPELPPCLQGTTVRVEFGDATAAADPSGANAIARSFPHTYGQPLAHFLRATTKVAKSQTIDEHPAVKVGLVFCGRQSPGGHNVVWGGSDGLFAQKTLEITDDVLATYKNQGGYDLLGRTKDQIRTTEQVNSAMAACKALKLDGLVIVGGVTSNTDAAQLAETFAEAKCSTKVVGVPVTLNGDLKNQFVEANVGFDTICKVNSQLISNVCTDALSAEKYYYFIRLMDKNHGVILLPEGLIESIPELLLHPESDDSAQLSQIETEKLLAELGKKFNAICHFFGYQARGSLPSKFDCDYAYVLGHSCYHILAAGLNGYMATVTNLKSPSNKWRCGAAPISVAMMTVKHYGRGSGSGSTTLGKPVVHPATVDLRGKVYELLRQNATRFLMDDVYRNPGPLQFDGPGADSKAVSLCVEDLDYMGRIKELNEYLDKVRTIVKPGCSQDVLKAALSAMSSVTDILSVMTSQRLE
ncbi:Phosphofructokinase domain-containing protein [Cynara cardunculus var. scolymus]|uniref:Phosphofructokinase domain-containing protein n=1 Tax=Cynara cardunculus var. scolymus TaxID=59895 RepID=A0A118K4J4_CYNCS|nr:Phosphofructokinase domain-containing protein [Cynara cardunculus var. scolymus]